MAQNGTTAKDKKVGGARGSQSQPPFDEGMQEVKRKYEKSYRHINQALTCDEQKQLQQAVDNYAKGIRYMNAALAIWSQLCHDHPDEARASNMGSKMEKMSVNLSKAQRRVDELLAFSRNNASSTNSVRTASEREPPPSYDASMARQHRPPMNSASAANAMTDAKLLLFVEGGVQIYFISIDGNVSAPSYPSSLAVYQFLDQGACQTTADSPPAFLEVGDWIYPLMPTVSPALHADWGAYIFPDVSAKEAGCFVGVIIPDTLDAASRQKLEEILQTFTNFREQVPGETSDTTGAISKGIKTAAEWISWGFTKGAEKTGQLVKYGSEKLRQHMEPEQEPSNINPSVQKGAQRVRAATGGAVKISEYLVDKVGQASSALAKTIAPHVRRTSEYLMPASWTSKDSSSGRSSLDKVSEVAASGLQGFSTVYLGLERSAMILAKSVADQTVQTVEYKYGQDAGKLTEDVVYSASNIVAATSTVNRLGVKAVAKQVAKETGADAVRQQAHGASAPPSSDKKGPQNIDQKAPHQAHGANAPPPSDKKGPQNIDQKAPQQARGANAPPSSDKKGPQNIDQRAPQKAHGDKKGSQNIDQKAPPHTDKIGPPNGDKLGPRHGDKTGPPNGNRNSHHQPHSDDKGPSQGNKNGHSHGDKKGPPSH